MNPTTAKGIVDLVQARVRRERATRRDQLEWTARQAIEKEKRRIAFVKDHGGLIWRAAAFYGANRFVTSVLNCFQGWGDLTPSQLEGLRRAVSFLELGLTRGPIK